MEMERIKLLEFWLLESYRQKVLTVAFYWNGVEWRILHILKSVLLLKGGPMTLLFHVSMTGRKNNILWASKIGRFMLPEKNQFMNDKEVLNADAVDL
jgi:hypothetical protein